MLYNLGIKGGDNMGYIIGLEKIGAPKLKKRETSIQVKL
jgi:hypothetical protein